MEIAQKNSQASEFKILTTVETTKKWLSAWLVKQSNKERIIQRKLLPRSALPLRLNDAPAPSVAGDLPQLLLHIGEYVVCVCVRTGDLRASDPGPSKLLSTSA